MGVFGENFPYTNFHDMNMDWIIKIAKDFLDQYTQIQEIISDGEQSLDNKIQTGLHELDTEKEHLVNLLDQWYNTHSQDIANELSSAITTLSNTLATTIALFNTSAEEKAELTIASIPQDYTALANKVNDMDKELSTNTDNLLEFDDFTATTYKGVTFTNLKNGKCRIQGTATATSAFTISEEITLPPGTYRFGFLEQSPMSLQIRDYTGGSDGGQITGATSTNKTFTIEQTKIAVFRLYFTPDTYDATVAPMITLADKWYKEFVPFKTANDAVARELSTQLDGKYFKLPIIPNNTDLNDITDSGTVRLVSTYTYVNAPEITNENSIMEVFKTDGTDYVVQRVYTYGHTAFQAFSRVKSGSPATWGNWQTNLDSNRLDYAEMIEENADFDTLTTMGWYRAVSSRISTYTNNPPMTGNYLLITTKITDNYIIQQTVNYGNKSLKIYSRIKSGSPSTWGDWYCQIDVDNINSIIGSISELKTLSFTPTAMLNRGANIGTNLRILNYNIANYNNDSATKIPNDKLLTLKKFIRGLNPDIITLQEDTTYIDNDNTKTADSYVYFPVHPFCAGAGGPTIRTKINYSQTETLKYSNGRVLRFAIYTIDNKTLMVVNTHPYPMSAPDAESYHAIQYDELFKWITGQIALELYSGSTPVSVPTWTHCIIGMDANSGTDTDKNLLIQKATSANFTMGNGGEFGWFVTLPERGNRAENGIDNIIVSNNIIINNIECYPNMYKELYSDHVPLMADLTLL